MKSIKNKFFALLLASATANAFAVTDDQVFAYAQANFPSLFAGTPAAGQYEQYNYRYYAGSDCYLAVDTTKSIWMLGRCTGGDLTPVGPVSDYSDMITAWEAASASIDYSGTWTGLFFGTTVAYKITQTGANLVLKSVPTVLTAEQTYTGTINGNSARISTTDYATATATLTAIDRNTVRVVQESCSAIPANAIYCLASPGTAITFTRQ
jgi:hypothetical protein